MGLKSALKKLGESIEFKDWSKKNPDNFLSYALKIIEEKKESPWQLGYYHKSTDKLETFVVNENTIEVQKEEEIFKKPDTKIRPIDMQKIKLPFKKILKNIDKFQKDKYPKELISKTIAILQNLED